MKAILSIKPEFVEKIMIGEKKYEFRRKIFKQNVDTVIVYASSPVKAIVGEFIIEDILNSDLETLWDMTHKEAGISKDFFLSYFKYLDKGYAIKIKSFIPYEKFIDINQLGIAIPPQSYIYLKNYE